MTNMVDVYVNHLRRKLDAGYGRPLIRTIRGIGYQIGTNGFVFLLSFANDLLRGKWLQ